MPSQTDYPVHTLFNSQVWKDRLHALGMGQNRWRIAKRFGIKIAYRDLDYLVDFEAWPTEGFPGPQDLAELRGKADLVYLRKLPPETRPSSLPVGSWTWVSTVSPYLTLKTNFHPDTNAMANIRRRARQLERQSGAIRLGICAADLSSRRSWFDQWKQFQISRQEVRGEQSILVQPYAARDFETWVLAGELPDWVKLFELYAGNQRLACALCYVWKGIFYFQLPGYDADPKLKRFGIGKLLVQKLIEWAQEQELEVFDFLQGDEAYKRDWKPQRRNLFQCEIALTPIGRMTLFLRRIKRGRS